MSVVTVCCPCSIKATGTKSKGMKVQETEMQQQHCSHAVRSLVEKTNYFLVIKKENPNV